MEYLETVVVGAGQAGLSTSYYLSQQGIEHIVLDKSSQAANNWRNGTWDSFTLITPNWAFRMPGIKQNGNDPDGYMPRNKVIEFFDNYIDYCRLPVKFNTIVNSVEKMDGEGYLIQTNDLTYKSKNVIIATGIYQYPRLPKFSPNFSSNILQLHSSQYRNPGLIPDGAVLIAGSGSSGCQIAKELHDSGRKVYLCVGTAGRVPRRYRGADILKWLEELRFFDLTLEQFPPGTGKFDGIPHLSGKNGGQTINLHQFVRDGITLLGHIKGAEKYQAVFATDLHQNLLKIDQFDLNIRDMIDKYIQSNNLNSPYEKVEELKDGYKQSIIEKLDLKEADVNTIIWAGGYSFDYSLVKMPVLDPDGFPIQQRGVTSYPGLYFVGLPWMPSQRSGFLIGVAECAKYIAEKITEKRNPPV